MFRILICLLLLLCTCHDVASAQSYGDAFSSQATAGVRKCSCKKDDDAKTISTLRSFLSGLTAGLRNRWQQRDSRNDLVDGEPRILAIFEKGVWTVKCAEAKAARPEYIRAMNIVKETLLGKSPPIKTPFGIVIVFDREDEVVVSTNVSGALIPRGRSETRPSLACQRDVDFGPYMADLQRKIKRAWIPPGVVSPKPVVVVFKVQSNGSVTNLRLVNSSDLASADRAGLTAILNAEPFKQLPDGSPSDVDIQFTFNLDGNAHKCESGSPLCEFALSSAPDLVWFRRTDLHSPVADLVLPGRFHAVYGEF